MITIKVALPEDRVERLKEVARRRGVSPGAVAREGIEKLLRIKPTEHGAQSRKVRSGKGAANSLSVALGLFATNKRPPTDKEVERILSERRKDKHGCR